MRLFSSPEVQHPNAFVIGRMNDEGYGNKVSSIQPSSILGARRSTSMDAAKDFGGVKDRYMYTAWCLL